MEIVASPVLPHRRVLRRLSVGSLFLAATSLLAACWGAGTTLAGVTSTNGRPSNLASTVGAGSTAGTVPAAKDGKSFASWAPLNHMTINKQANPILARKS